MNQQLSTFFVGGLMFGINVHHVQEIIRYQEMTSVPLSSPVIKGLINLRGQIITAIDLRLRLCLDEEGNDAQPMNVVVRVQEEVVSLLVDQIGDVIETKDIAYETTPETLDPLLKDLVTGVFKLDGKLLLMLNTERTVDVSALQ